MTKRENKNSKSIQFLSYWSCGIVTAWFRKKGKNYPEISADSSFENQGLIAESLWQKLRKKYLLKKEI
jgi:hypothetical protein